MAELRDSSVRTSLDAATSLVKTVTEALAAFIVVLIQELDFLLFSHADGTGRQHASNQLIPSVIRVTERYVDQVKVSGNREMERGNPSGRIEVTVPYDGQNYLGAQPIQLGTLHFDSYGHSNLNRQPNPSLDSDTLPIRIDLRSHQVQANGAIHFRLAHGYQPEKPERVPLVVQVEVLDEDEAKDEKVIVKEWRRKRARQQPNEKIETVEQMLVRHIKRQVGLKRNLLIRFRINLFLPEHLGIAHEGNAIEVSHMTLQWPIATPHRVARLRFSGIQSRPIVYNPEQKIIEWKHIPLKARGKVEGNTFYAYSTGLINLNIEEPAEIYRQQELSGSVTVELSGLLSGLQVDYFGTGTGGTADVSIQPHTTLTTKFSLRLDECFEQKNFAPEQHLQFPGVVLSDMRLADIIMLLKDKRFEPTTDKKDKWVLAEVDEKEPRLRQYVIQARRNEGTRELIIWMLIQGIEAGTTRERRILGREKYTTDLPAGSTVIHIRGRLEGDSKRVVNVINEIQMQLKEQFRHVSAIE